MSAQATPVGVGAILRQWRERRRVSQLDLALRTNVSARHVSFIETGRSKPSPAMILRLAEQLDVPMRDRNALLLAAGHAPAYPETPLNEPALAPLREVVDQLLRGYEPYPALVFNADYDVVAANEAVALMLDGVASHLLEPPVNTMRLALHPEGLASRITNYGQVREHLLARCARHLDLWRSDTLQELYAELSAYPMPAAGQPAGPDAAFALPIRLRVNGAELALISVVGTFNTPLDVTVSELAIETYLPADPQTAKLLQQRRARPARLPPTSQGNAPITPGIPHLRGPAGEPAEVDRGGVEPAARQRGEAGKHPFSVRDEAEPHQ
jgi:transcriptional regulator with XRE-family HTH domain